MKSKPSQTKKNLKQLLAHSWFVFRHISRGILYGFSAVMLLLFIAFLSYQYVHRWVSPKIITLITANIPESSKLYARDGTLLYEIYNEVKRTPVRLDAISPYLQQATVAIEDKNFYNHKGISLESLFRSAVTDYYLQDTAYGGSTITQQLIKNTVLVNKKSFTRKIAEIIWSLETERYLTKQDILERYINQIPYGRNCLGAECAAQSYFGKAAKDLSLAESAYLAALPQAPSLYSPSDASGRKLLDARKNYILEQMYEQGYISKEQLAKAASAKVIFKPVSDVIKAPHFSLWVKQNLINFYGKQVVEEGGLKVYTTLDMRLQTLAEETVDQFSIQNGQKYNAHNAALVATNPKNGEILAMVGSKNFFGQSEPSGCQPGKNCLFEPYTNLATALRQPGSSFKPYVYATAFGPEFRYGPASIILDSPTNFSVRGATPYIPQNYNGHFYGRVSMRKALAGSLNVPAVRTASLVGIEAIINTARSMGISSPMENCGLSLALGSCEVSLVDHVTGFGVLAAGGVYNGKTGILSIEDKTGNTIRTHDPAGEQAIDPQAAYEVVSIMTDNQSRTFIFGSDSPLTLSGRSVGAKTGTTQNWKDGWTVGFTPSLAAGVWAGNNDGTLLASGADGVFVAAPLWHAFMEKALAGTPVEEFSKPSSLQYLPVDTATGKPLANGKTSRVQDFFADYALPKSDTTKPKPAAKVFPEDLDAAEKLRLAEAGVDPMSLLYSENLETKSTLPPTAEIISPKNELEIYKLPLNIIVKAENASDISRIELLLNGQYVAESEGPLFLFKLENLPQNGLSTLIARVISREGSFIDSPPVHIYIYLPQNSLH